LVLDPSHILDLAESALPLLHVVNNTFDQGKNLGHRPIINPRDLVISFETQPLQLQKKRIIHSSIH
jgi:hypothetical protein